MGTKFLFGDDEKGMEMYSGDACTTFWMHLMPLNTPKSIKMVNFVMGIYLPVYNAYHGICVCMCMCVYRVKNIFLPQSKETSFI